MTARELSILGLRFAALWIRVQAMALVLLAVASVAWWIFLLFTHRELPPVALRVYVVAAPIALLVMARLLRRSPQWFVARHDNVSKSAGDERLTALVAAVLVLYGLWLASSGTSYIFRAFYEVALLGYTAWEWFSESGGLEVLVWPVFEIVVGILFVVAGQGIARWIVRMGSSRIDDADIDVAGEQSST